VLDPSALPNTAITTALLEKIASTAVNDFVLIGGESATDSGKGGKASTKAKGKGKEEVFTYTDVTLLSNSCYTFVLLLHCCQIFVTLLSHCCHTVILLLLKCCYSVVTILLHRRYTVVKLLLNCFYTCYIFVELSSKSATLLHCT
jgi:hypothetical protein